MWLRELDLSLELADMQWVIWVFQTFLSFHLSVFSFFVFSYFYLSVFCLFDFLSFCHLQCYLWMDVRNGWDGWIVIRGRRYSKSTFSANNRFRSKLSKRWNFTFKNFKISIETGKFIVQCQQVLRRHIQQPESDKSEQQEWESWWQGLADLSDFWLKWLFFIEVTFLKSGVDPV